MYWNNSGTPHACMVAFMDRHAACVAKRNNYTV